MEKYGPTAKYAVVLLSAPMNVLEPPVFNVAALARVSILNKEVNAISALNRIFVKKIHQILSVAIFNLNTSVKNANKLREWD